jgi:hypothetical protein
VIVEPSIVEALLREEVPHLADRARHRDELGREAQRVLGLPTLEALEALDGLVESPVGLVPPNVHRPHLVADLDEDLRREIDAAVLRLPRHCR